MKKRIVAHDKVLNDFEELDSLISRKSFINDSIEDLKKDFPYEVEKTENVLRERHI